MMKRRLGLSLVSLAVVILNIRCITEQTGINIESTSTNTNSPNVQANLTTSPSSNFIPNSEFLGPLPSSAAETSTPIESTEPVEYSPTLNPSVPVPPSAEPELTALIDSINVDPYKFEDQIVEVIGHYMGWDLGNDVNASPPITRSDWVIRDDSGGIYVHSRAISDRLLGLEPSNVEDTETVLHVFGRVKISKKNLPYLQAIEVIKVEQTSPLIGSILSNINDFILEEVDVAGFYCGWDLLDEIGAGPPVSRSDWVISDASGAIYVSAKSSAHPDVQLDPSDPNSTGIVVRVRGIVQKNNSNQPFIVAVSIDVLDQ